MTRNKTRTEANKVVGREENAACATLSNVGVEDAGGCRMVLHAGQPLEEQNGATNTLLYATRSSTPPHAIQPGNPAYSKPFASPADFVP